MARSPRVGGTQTAVELTAGIVGTGRRGGGFRAGLDAAGIRVTAVCDVDAARLPAAAAGMGARQQYVHYEQMLERSGIEAVLIASPMQLHVPMAIAALERDIHVLSEVPADVSVDECRALVRACRASRAAYMMAENCVYLRNNMLQYVHELKARNEQTPWRRTWQTGIAGVTHGTHSLGPILQWLRGTA